jgi:hypothetical protein
LGLSRIVFRDGFFYAPTQTSTLTYLSNFSKKIILK